MTVRTAALKAVNAARKLLGPTATDLHTYTVTVRTRSWTGGDTGAEVRLGTSTDSDLVITPRPHVTETDGGAGLTLHVTPAHSGGGYTVAQLNPAPTLTAGQESYYVVTGPNGTYNYAVVDIDTSKALRYTIRLAALERQAPL